MDDKFKNAADAVLAHTVAANGGAPGVVAMVTDRKGNLYEGAAGKRELGKDQPMTLDLVMAIFSMRCGHSRFDARDQGSPKQRLVGNLSLAASKPRRPSADQNAELALPTQSERMAIEPRMREALDSDRSRTRGRGYLVARNCRR